MTDQQQKAIVAAVLYAMREGCFFPVCEPAPDAGIRVWIQWGAMRNLHTAVMNATRSEAGQP